jgi:hypothetical protein
MDSGPVRRTERGRSRFQQKFALGKRGPNIPNVLAQQPLFLKSGIP